ncbi:MAG: hypothetical protein BAA01_11595 [Bacillus thermozeamaize]|uniref:Uncharacterized protein n=1 Tax=Bacillus thermozeamaize TaxID=230954 RepID=A0A1Y3PGY3_9BACI|nr:MAG: hypothetical protein BAA01_11595 [Bacillus thermozeamaize]
MWLEPKTNWGPDDYYNFYDLNRVEANTEYIAELISYFGTPPVIVTITDRTMKRIEFQDSLDRVDENIRLLAQRYKPPGWNDAELNTPIDWRDVNRWEQNLKLLYVYYQGNIDAFRYCGMYTCGEEGV